MKSIWNYQSRPMTDSENRRIDLQNEFSANLLQEMKTQMNTMFSVFEKFAFRIPELKTNDIPLQ